MRTLWRLLERAIPDRGWFFARFIAAAEVVVARWAPHWARRQILGRPLGVWALLGTWMGIPLVVAIAW